MTYDVTLLHDGQMATVFEMCRLGRGVQLAKSAVWLARAVSARHPSPAACIQHGALKSCQLRWALPLMPAVSSLVRHRLGRQPGAS